MADSLTARLARVRRRVRRLLAIYGASWVAAVAVGSVLLVGTLDWLLHLDDPGVRLILAAAILAAIGWTAWRRLLRPLFHPLDYLEVAQRIERRFPQFRDSLASTVEFLQSGTSPHVGSPVLQQAVAAAAHEELERVNLTDLIETRPVRRAATAAVVIIAVACAVAALSPQNASLALTRLARPFQAAAWPRQVELRLLDADLSPVAEHGRALRRARGEELEFFVENVKGELPRDLAVQFRVGDRPIERQRLRTSTLRDDAGRPREVGALRLLLTDGPLQFRAVGGDDDRMPWHLVEVVPPPELVSLRVTVTPPAYSGLPAQALPEGVGRIDALAGSTVAFDVRANKLLRSAALSLKSGRTQPLAVTKDGLGIQGAFAVEEGTSAYSFELTDQEGFRNTNARQYEIRGIADLVPSVSVDEPESDLQVTKVAEVPLTIVAKDDLGLTTMSLHYHLGDSEGTKAQQILLETAAQPQQQARIEKTWRLADLALSEGMRVVFHAEARDRYNLDSEHVGKSVERTLIVVSPEEKALELASRQTELLQELDRIHSTQRDNYGHTGELLSQMAQVGRLRPQDVDLLKRIELEQAHVGARLGDSGDGVAARAAELLREHRANQIDDPETQRRLEQIVAELNAAAQDHLPVIDQNLTLARKQAQLEKWHEPSPDAASQRAAQSPANRNEAVPAAEAGTDPPTSSERPGEERTSSPVPAQAPRNIADALAAAHENQKAVLETVQALLDNLSEWRDQRALSNDLQEALTEQEQLAAETSAAGQKWLSRALSDLSPQERADLKRLADRQAQQAGRVDELRRKLAEAAQAAEKVNAAAAERYQATAEHLDDEMVAATMRESADRLAENNIGQAAEGQRKALSELQAALEILKNNTSDNTETLVKKLQQAEEQLESLTQEQRALQARTQEQNASDDPQRLKQEQQQLEQAAGALSRRLKRLRSTVPAETAGRAAARMADAENALDQGDRSRAAGEQQTALDNLEQAQREVARERIQAEERLAREMLEQLAGSLDTLIAREQSIIDETNRLETERTRRGNWSRAQLKSLSNLEAEQRRLQAETDELVGRLGAAEVFALALRGAARQMALAADRLAQRETGPETVAREEAARRRFADLLAALQPEPPQPSSDEPPPADDVPQENGPPGESIPPVAQLKMLAALQEEILRRTAALDEARTRNELTPEQRAELEALAAEQQELADLARNLTAGIPSSTPDEPQQAQ